MAARHDAMRASSLYAGTTKLTSGSDIPDPHRLVIVGWIDPLVGAEQRWNFVVHLDFRRGGRSFAQRIERPAIDPVDQLQSSIKMLDESRAALYPIAVVAVQNTVYFAQLRVMNVAANDTVQSTAERLVHHGIGKGADILHCVFHPLFEIGR